MKRNSKGEMRRLRAAIVERAAGCCEVCGSPFIEADMRLRSELHHRKLRSRGGRDTLENCVLVHMICHMRAHQYPAWATEVGWMVASWDNPAEVEVKVIPRKVFTSP